MLMFFLQDSMIKIISTIHMTLMFKIARAKMILVIKTALMTKYQLKIFFKR